MNIAIWGAGNFGKYIYGQLCDRENIKVSCFLDKSPKLQGEKIDDIEIIAPEKLCEYGGENIACVLIAFLNGLGVYNELKKCGNWKFGIVKDIVFLKQLSLVSDIDKDSNIFWVENVEKPLLYVLETNIVDFCNLNCKGCSHFSNLYKKGEMVTFENYCKDLSGIVKNVNVYKFNLLGGETLLNERLNEYMIFARSIMPGNEIWVITNGLLLLKQSDGFFECCVENNIGIDITEYNPTAKIINKIIDILEKHKITYHIRHNRDDFGKNIDLLARADKIEAMKNCREHDCHFFRNGKLYKCPFEALGNKFFEHYNLEIRLSGGIDIHDTELNWHEVAYQLDNKPVDACKYCGPEVRFDWEISNNPTIDEWIIN